MRGDQRVELLEDARDRRQVRRPDLGELGDDLLRVAAEVGERRAHVEHGELDQQRERVREREEQVGDVAGLDDRVALAHRDDVAVVAVAEHAALRRPGRPRRVDDRVRLVARDGVRAPVQLGGVARAAALAQRVERDRVADVAGRVDHDDRLQRRQVVAHRADLGDLRRVLADDRARLGVAGDPLALLGRVRRVDRHDDRPGGGDAEVGVRPLRPGRAEDRHAIARLDPEVDQAAADLRHDLAELGVADVVPGAVALVADRRAVAVLLGGQPDQVGDRRRAGGPCVDRHRGAALHGSSSRSQRSRLYVARASPAPR